MVIASFQIKNKLGRDQFFLETFLLADISMKVVLKIPFFTFSNADIQFADKELIWRFYTTKETLLTIRRVKLINKKNLLRQY